MSAPSITNGMEEKTGKQTWPRAFNRITCASILVSLYANTSQQSPTVALRPLPAIIFRMKEAGVSFQQMEIALASLVTCRDKSVLTFAMQIYYASLLYT